VNHRAGTHFIPIPHTMFRRLVFEDSAALFTVAAFITAFCFFVTIAWRALRMKRPQLERFENLPFATPTPSAHDDDANSAA
jgi:hypothetical protein